MRKRELRLKTYQLVSRAVEEGAQFGVARAFKYEPEPCPEDLRGRLIDQVVHEVMLALDDVVDWGDDDAH